MGAGEEAGRRLYAVVRTKVLEGEDPAIGIAHVLRYVSAWFCCGICGSKGKCHEDSMVTDPY